jgi:hypothetical protein
MAMEMGPRLRAVTFGGVGLGDVGGASNFIAGLLAAASLAGAEAAVLRGKLEAVVHEAAVAAIVNLVAFYELFLGEGSELAVLDLEGTFKGTGGGECPA